MGQCICGFLLLMGCLLTAHVTVPQGIISDHVKKGINLNGWLNGERNQRLVSLSDLTRLAKLGFTFVRIPIDPQKLSVKGFAGLDSIGSLEAALDLTERAQLAAIVDIHPTHDFTRSILTHADSLHAFLGFVRRLSIVLSKRSSRSVALELLNEPFEPEGAHSWDWNAIQDSLWKTARSALPNHTLILTGATWSSITGLLTVRPVPDSNVLYTIHFYQPYVFTHQGANWFVKDSAFYSALFDVPYPVTDDSVQRVINKLAASNGLNPVLRDSIIRSLKLYAKEHWDADKIAVSFERASRWAAANHASLLLGEFGVYRRSADAADRCNWVRDVREAAESYKIPWALWEYRGGFGLLDEHGSLEKCMSNALGIG